MKYTLNKADYDALSDDMKKEYTLTDDTATLVVDGGPDVEGIEKKRQLEVEHRKTAETRLADAEKREAKLKKDMASAGGDAEKIDAIEKKHAGELEKLRTERQAETEKFTNERNKGLISKVATELSENFTVPGLMQSQISTRLSVEEVNGEPVVRVTDANGNPSTASVDDLKKEFLDNKEYSGIIKGKAGSGGGATNQGGSGASNKKISEMSATEQATFEKTDPEGFAAADKAEKA